MENSLVSVRVFGFVVANGELKLEIPADESLTGSQFTLLGRRGELSSQTNKRDSKWVRSGSGVV